jgi:transcriptional/translational regulatory protein YebC/TACO1
LSDDELDKVINLIEILEEHDDIQKVYANLS